MRLSNGLMIKGAAWTFGAYGAGQTIRLASNIVLARLLAPELFGIMVIVNSLRTAVSLLSDVGIGQNIVHNPKAEEPDFYHTAWTLRLIRGIALWIVCFAVAPLAARFYGSPQLAELIPVAGLFFVIGAMATMAPPLLQRRMKFVRLNILELAVQTVSSAAHILLAYFNPTVWSLIFGGLCGMAAHSIGTYLVMPGLRPRLFISKEYARQILSFGKWIFVSSILYFAAMNFDRLYLGKVASFELLGVYGIARTFSELVTALILRMNNYLIFPVVAAAQSAPRDELRRQLRRPRLTFILLGALGISILSTGADYVIYVLYDERYRAAAWMLPVLLVGAWFSLLSSLNEATLLGLGKPSYGATANAAKLAWLAFGLPLSFVQSGIVGAIVAIALADLWRYIPIRIGVVRERMAFAVQDIGATVFLFTLIALWQWLRWSMGYGTSLDGAPFPWWGM